MLSNLHRLHARTLTVILASLLSALTCLAQQRALTAADYARAEKFVGYYTSPLVLRAGVRPAWLPDGRFWYRVATENGNEFILVDPARGTRGPAFDHARLATALSAAAGAKYEAYKLPFQQIDFSPDAKTISFDIERRRWTCDLQGNQCSAVTGNRAESQTSGRRGPGGAPSMATSPDGKRLAFIRDYNLWVRDLATGQESQLTTDGLKDFGYATDNAGWRKSDRPVLLWSPDAKKIATFQQDQRHVSDMYLAMTNAGAPRLEAWKYPLPQDKDIIRIHRVIIEVESAKVIRLTVPPDARRGTLCDDISCTGTFDDNEWSPDATKLAFISSSRDHKAAKLRIADAVSGEVREVFEEKVATQYESGQGTINWRYLPLADEFIWYSEKDDWGHLYLYDLTTGKLKNQITKGAFVVTRLLKVDEKNRVLYFEANGREAERDPYFSHFYRVDFDGRNLTLLTPENGHHQIELAPGGKHFVDNFSKPDVPPVAVLRELNGKLIATLEQADIARLTAAGWKPPTPITVKSRDGRWNLYGLMFTPTNLDRQKKYPVVNYIYPGPQGGGVGSRSFAASRSDHQALAELGFIVVVIDGTCNPDRSKSFHDVCYGNMADNTLEDQIAGLRQLAAQNPFMDLERTGIWGHSGGGFATAAAMFRFPDFYKVGVSQSGNHDNRNYEDDWGERYIGLMVGENYQKQANQIYAKNLKGKLLLAHGGMDNNVPPYNTYLVVDALIKANKDFDLIIFPNARHGYGQDNFYMMRRRWDYFVRHLLGAEPPKEYELRPPAQTGPQGLAQQ